MENRALTFNQFVINENDKYSSMDDDYIATSYEPNWRRDEWRSEQKHQRYRNVKNSNILKVLKYIFEAGEEGRKYSDIHKFMWHLEADGKGKRRIRGGDPSWIQGEEDGIMHWTPGKNKLSKYDPVKDRGMGGTVLSGGDYIARQTGLLTAHCKRNEDGRWILTDEKLIEMFSWNDLDLDDNDVNLIKTLF